MNDSASNHGASNHGASNHGASSVSALDAAIDEARAALAARLRARPPRPVRSSPHPPLIAHPGRCPSRIP